MPNQSKGLSPLIATTMLILVAIAISILVSSWMSSLSVTESRRLENRTAQLLACKRGGLTITSASYNCSNDCNVNVNHTITLRIRNTGEIRLGINKIYLVNRSGVFYTLMPNVTSLDISDIKDAGNVSRELCSGINNSIEEITVTTSCPDVYDTFPGSNVLYQNC